MKWSSLIAVVIVLSLGAAPATRPTTGPSVDLHAGMVFVPGGTFDMGVDDPRFPDAGPVHAVKVDGFWMDATDVTNDAFARFVAATGYVTEAERRPDPRQFPGVPAEALVPGAAVFAKPDGPVPLDDSRNWFRYVPGACWKHPEGPATDLAGRGDHPVVDVSWADAVAYAKWAGKQLPTEAQWERAARGGQDRKPFAWGDVFQPAGRPMANTFQGHFPDADTAADGYAGTSPVKAYPANAYGLYDITGNVWQWCADGYDPAAYKAATTRPVPDVNPLVADPADAETPERSMRGGSFLCSDQYCCRFVVGSRGKGDPGTPSSHVGFRCAASGR